MNISDYLAVLVLSTAEQEIELRYGEKYVFSAEMLASETRSIVRKYIPNLEHLALVAAKKLVHAGIAKEILTPHAKPRYFIVLERDSLNPNNWTKPNHLEIPFSFYKDLGSGWLKESIIGALDSISDEEEGEEKIDLNYEVWEPLPLDRPDQYLDQLADKIEELEEQVRSDNGYAHDNSGERDGVIARLKGGAGYLRTAQVIAQGAVEALLILPLRTLVDRFGKAAIGAASKIALELLQDWLKRKLGLD